MARLSMLAVLALMFALMVAGGSAYAAQKRLSHTASGNACVEKYNKCIDELCGRGVCTKAG